MVAEEIYHPYSNKLHVFLVINHKASKKHLKDLKKIKDI